MRRKRALNDGLVDLVECEEERGSADLTIDDFGLFLENEFDKSLRKETITTRPKNEGKRGRGGH